MLDVVVHSRRATGQVTFPLNKPDLKLKSVGEDKERFKAETLLQQQVTDLFAVCIAVIKEGEECINTPAFTSLGTIKLWTWPATWIWTSVRSLEPCMLKIGWICCAEYLLGGGGGVVGGDDEPAGGDGAECG